MLLPDEIYRRRTALRKTQQQLAASVRVSAGHISNIENEKAELTRDLAVRIERQLREWENRIPPAATLGAQIQERLGKRSERELAEVLIFMEEQKRTS